MRFRRLAAITGLTQVRPRRSVLARSINDHNVVEDSALLTIGPKFAAPSRLTAYARKQGVPKSVPTVSYSWLRPIEGSRVRNGQFRPVVLAMTVIPIQHSPSQQKPSRFPSDHKTVSDSGSIDGTGNGHRSTV